MSGAGTSRRRFLKGALASGVAGVAMPHVIPSRVLAGKGRSGANDRIVLAVIGTGAMGSGLARHFNLFADVAIGAVADVDKQKGGEVAQQFDAALYQDYRRILDRDDIDAVVIATPEHWHGLPTIHAAQAGLDIYCEKPVSLTVREGRKMVEAVRKYDRVFQTGSQDRSRLANWLACMHVRNGRLGKIERVIGHNHPSPMLNGMPGQDVPDDLDWDLWSGPVQPHPYNAHLRAVRGWVPFRDFAGHGMTSNGTHGMDQIQWALGMDEAGPVDVWTEGEPFAPPTYRGGPMEGPALHVPRVLMRYPGDITMELGDAPLWGGVFIGEKGRVTISRGEFAFEPEELGPGQISEDAIEDAEVKLYRSENHHRNWLDCIKGRGEPVAGVEIGQRSATVCHLANIARWVSEITGETGERLKWDAQQERFTNSDWGNHLLDRPRRKPFQLPEKV